MNINKNIKMKSTLSALAVVIMACGIMSCNKQPQANDTKETPKTAATPKKNPTIYNPTTLFIVENIQLTNEKENLC